MFVWTCTLISQQLDCSNVSFQYNEMEEMVEIGIHGPQWSPQADLRVIGWRNTGLEAREPYFSRQDCVCLDLQSYHSSLIDPMSHYECNESEDKVEIGIHGHSGHHRLTFEPWH